MIKKIPQQTYLSAMLTSSYFCSGSSHLLDFPSSLNRKLFSSAIVVAQWFYWIDLLANIFFHVTTACKNTEVYFSPNKEECI